MRLHGITYNLEALGAWAQPWYAGVWQRILEHACGVVLEVPGTHIGAVVVN